jgi:pyruvyl transferase EpsO
MNFFKKKEQLCKVIIDTLTPIIDNDFILLDLPYHTNIGDILIWEGEIQFLRNLTNYKLLYSCNSSTYCYQKIDRHIIILLQGGGNFGNIWYNMHQFKEQIITSYPDNKIVIFPQTVWYTDKNILLHDVNVYSAHRNLVLCVRDSRSYEFMKKYFTKNTILLVPDMAFCIPFDQLKKYQVKPINKKLFLKRSDKEFNANFNYMDFIVSKENIDIYDWPTIDRKKIYTLFLECLLWISRRIRFFFPKFTDLYASFFFRLNMIRTGIRFISKYESVYTTRLHVAILCCLLDKPFVLFDNSYGKNHAFFETWFKDLDGAIFHSCH